MLKTLDRYQKCSFSSPEQMTSSRHLWLMAMWFECLQELKLYLQNPKDKVVVKGLWQLAELLVDPCRPGDFNQPAKRHAYAQTVDNVFTPVDRELVFDIDMTDYDDVRYCCSSADVCLNCWPLMTIAIKVIDTALRDDFDFNHILWVYSGRRGVHCWVCDGKARRLSNEQRSAIAEYFRVYKGGENSHKKVIRGSGSSSVPCEIVY